MKKLIAVLLILALSTLDMPSPTTRDWHQLHPVSWGIAEAQIFGLGKPKYNKRRTHRQNSIKAKNRSTKRLLRKNGIGQYSTRPVENWAWMLPNIDWRKEAANA